MQELNSDNKNDYTTQIMCEALVILLNLSHERDRIIQNKSEGEKLGLKFFDQNSTFDNEIFSSPNFSVSLLSCFVLSPSRIKFSNTTNASHII